MFRAERTNFRGVILLHSTDNKKVSQLGSWTESVDYKKENILPGSPSPPRRAQSSIRESNASSCWGFLGRQCCSAEHQHCIQSTPKVAWETALQRGELFHLVLFKPQKAILNPRISSGINTRSYETLSLDSCNTAQCVTLLWLLSHNLHLLCKQQLMKPHLHSTLIIWMKPSPWEGTDGTKIKDYSHR